jgi:8-oxo-dGDP phosphatase
MSYEVRERATVYDGVMSRVRVDRVAMPDGDVAEREVVEHTDAVAVVPLEANGDVVLLRHYRHPVGQRLLEVPAGKLDEEGEAIEEAARRELAEEVGLAAGDLEELIRFHNSAGWNDESTTIFLAEGVTAAATPDGFTPSAEESDLEVVRMPLAEAYGLALRGEVPDAKTAIGLLIAGARRASP